MPNGFHSHYCPRCKADKDCSQITHCRRLPESLCADCAYDDYLESQRAKAKVTEIEHVYHSYGGGTFGED